MNNSIYIVLLNYNGYEDTMDCIKSLEDIKYDNYNIVVVDNNSPDGSYEKLKLNLEGKHTLIRAKENGGFAKGNNIGIKYALDKGAEYILLLNNDTLVHKDFLKELIKPFNKYNNVGITTGKIYYEEDRNRFWFAGGMFNQKRFYGQHIGEGEEDRGQYDEEKQISFSTGCLMLIKREVFKKISGLSEEYFMYYEDVDFSLKVQQQGFKIYYTPKAKIYHKVSASTGGEASPFAIKWNTRNRLILLKKNKNSMKPIEYINKLCFFYLSRAIKTTIYTLQGEKEKKRALVEGMRLGIKYKV